MKKYILLLLGGIAGLIGYNFYTQKKSDPFIDKKPPINYPPAKGDQQQTFVYTVLFGDCLSIIAEKFNVKVSDILDFNPSITDPDIIYVGQKIIIPTGSTHREYANWLSDLIRDIFKTSPYDPTLPIPK